MWQRFVGRQFFVFGGFHGDFDCFKLAVVIAAVPPVFEMAVAPGGSS